MKRIKKTLFLGIRICHTAILKLSIPFCTVPSGQATAQRMLYLFSIRPQGECIGTPSPHQSHSGPAMDRVRLCGSVT